MGVLNFGSLNVDAVYRVEHIVRPGETLSSSSYRVFAGGKGANQSMALARAGASVAHAGKVGEDGRWVLDKLKAAGVDIRHTAVVAEPNGRAIIQVDDAGQNAIVLFAGTNKQITRQQISDTLSGFAAGDWLLLQNEINEVGFLIEQARARGMKVCLNPAPFDAQVPRYPLDLLDLIILNETEAAGVVGKGGHEELAERLRKKLPGAEVVLTCGARGAIWCRQGRGDSNWVYSPAHRVKAVDTTGAGDTFIGYFLAALVEGQSPSQALALGQRAAAICVTRAGAMDSIPTRQEVERFREDNG